jgi:hypothetical protein
MVNKQKYKIIIYLLLIFIIPTLYIYNLEDECERKIKIILSNPYSLIDSTNNNYSISKYFYYDKDKIMDNKLKIHLLPDLIEFSRKYTIIKYGYFYSKYFKVYIKAFIVRKPYYDKILIFTFKMFNKHWELTSIIKDGDVNI